MALVIFKKKKQEKKNTNKSTYWQNNNRRKLDEIAKQSNFALINDIKKKILSGRSYIKKEKKKTHKKRNQHTGRTIIEEHSMKLQNRVSLL